MDLTLDTLSTEDLRPLADRAYERLREALVEGTLPPGAKLSERGLAQALGVSAQPVREALRRLEGEGMVETRPRSGSFVAALDTARLVEMGRIRAALEGAAAGLADLVLQRVELALGRLAALHGGVEGVLRAEDLAADGGKA